MDNSKYYFVKRKGDQAYPLVDILNLTKVKFGKEDILKVVIGKPVPSKPVMADFLGGGGDFFDKRITDVMKSLNMEGVRFFPVELDNTKGTIYNNYECVSVEDNTYELLDKEHSDFTFSSPLYSYKKLVIDREKLSEIPLNKRLGMRLREAPSYYLYHESVVDAIMELEPTGMYFQDIEEYGFY